MVTWPQIVTAIVAGMAFVLSIVSLSFQWWSWRSGGAKLKVAGSTMKVIGPGIGIGVVAVDVTNHGRLPGQVASIWLMPAVGKGNGLFPMQGATVKGEFPGTVPGQSTEQWLFRAAPIQLECVQLGYERLVPHARLGTGKTIKGRPFRVRSISSVSPETES